jgi:hypothetical protein
MSEDFRIGLGSTVLLALAPTVVSLITLISGAIDGKMLVLLPIASLAYLAVLGYTYVKHVPGTLFSVPSFVIAFTLLNIGAWFAGCFLLIMSTRLGN